jgi:hypothetical protein
LYRRLLGRDFDRLPEALRRFHESAVGGGAGTGVFCVQRSTHASGRAVARALRLPPEGDRVAVALRVTVERERELWERTFGACRLQTRQWLEGGRLIERTGAAKLAFDVVADERGMRFRSAGFSWLGVRVPRAIAIEVEADVKGFDAYWEVAVVVRAPRLGIVTSYGGRITPTQ